MTDSPPVSGAAPAGPRVSHSRNMVTALIGNGYPAVIAFFTGPILAQALGVDGRGFVAAAAAPLALVTTIATLGVPEAVTYTVARSPHLARAAGSRGLVILVGAGILATGIVALAAPLLSDGRAPVQRLIYVACLAIVPSLMVAVLRGVAAAHQRWRLVTLERICSSTLRLVVLVPFWLTDSLTPLIATIAVAAMPVMGGLVYAGILRRPKEAGVGTETTGFGALLSYGSRIWIGSLSGVLLMRVDQTILTPLAGTYALGLYVVAVSISELPLIINSAVRDVMFVTEAHESVDDRLSASARISTFMSAVIGTALGVSAIWWLPFLFGQDFAAAVPVCGILLVAVVLGMPGSVAGAGLSARGNPGLRSRSLVVACVVNIALLCLLSPGLGAIGAALATLVGNLLASNLNLYFLWRVHKVPPSHFYGIRSSDIATLRRFVTRLMP